MDASGSSGALTPMVMAAGTQGCSRHARWIERKMMRSVKNKARAAQGRVRTSLGQNNKTKNTEDITMKERSQAQRILNDWKETRNNGFYSRFVASLERQNNTPASALDIIVMAVCVAVATCLILRGI
jgi:hypothetical protein